MLGILRADPNEALPQKYLVDVPGRSMTRVPYETALSLRANHLLQWSEGTAAVSSKDLVHGDSAVIWTIATQGSEYVDEVAPDGEHALVCAVPSGARTRRPCRVVSQRWGTLGEVELEPEALGVARWVVYDALFHPADGKDKGPVGAMGSQPSK